MFELVAGSGCGYVLMHIEGPPRVDRRAARLRRRRRPPQGLVRGASRAGRWPWVSPRSRSRSTPASTSTSPPTRTSRSCAASASCATLGLPLYVSLSRKDFIGAVLAGSWEERWPAGEREWGTVAAVALAVRAGADILRIHDRVLPAGDQGRRRDPGGRTDAARRKSLLETPWAIAIDPARRDGRIVAESSEEERSAQAGGDARLARPGVRRGAGSRVGVERLYSHQREALEAAASSNLVITSGTASGKSLAFNLPVLDGIARDPKRRALYLYPTKALAQDQARKLAELRPPGLREAIYDGDTPREERPAIRRRSNLVLTNPDMLHVGLLPNHKSWGDFLANLGWVVVDEAHTYRGVFGSHVANVLRRLRRVARAYGAEPRFLLASATIANPVELAERLVGEPFELIDDDGAPRAGREIAMWNPPLIDEATGTRRSPLSEAAELLAELVSQGVRTICFLKSRRGIELIQRFAGEELERRGKPELAKRIAPYRGGYTPQQRREIEARLAAGELLAVVATDALELGIDVGELDAAICVTFPGTVASLRQMWGRAGPPPPRPRRLRRRPGRARPVLLPPPGRVHRPPGRGGDPRPRKRADRRPPPGRRRLRAAALRRGRRDLRRRAGASGPSGWSSAGELRGAARQADADAQRVRRRPRSRCARPRPTRSR